MIEYPDHVTLLNSNNLEGILDYSGNIDINSNASLYKSKSIFLT